ncbi:MAG: HlyD family efflux transporter periplasmic adaptor subunit [Burkholderiaceae bacterium]|nr:HlyD family efflux transporter periplasmic adaptor subunit [Burkholderiaceae bacterium]
MMGSLRVRAGRYALWLLIAVAALAAAGWSFWPRALPYEVATVVQGRFEQTIREDGRLRVRQRYLVTAPTAAELERVELKVGDAVTVGQPIAHLRPAAPQMIDARTRAVLQARVGSAEAGQRAAAADVERQRTAQTQARLESERTSRLAAERFVSPAAREQAELAYQAQTMALQAASERAHLADHALAEARAALARAQGAAGAGMGEVKGRWTLASPIAGRILKIHQESGGPIAAGQPILEIGDTNRLEALVDLLSGDALRVPIGAPVRLSLGQSLPALTGRVMRVEPVAFTKVSALGIEEQRVNLVIGIDPASDGALATGDGFRVDATITVRTQDSALLIPVAALVRIGSNWSAWVVRDGRAYPVEVDVRDRSPDTAWIASGLSAGQQVLLYPGGQVREGQRVAARAGPPPVRP